MEAYLLLLVMLPSVALGFSTKYGSVERTHTASRDAGESWDYVTVRPKAHMFYWLMETTHSSGYKNRPLILWLQGGPGGSSTGFGNFGELGPLDADLNPRNTTWLQSASLLFIDNPVGTGYSYVEEDSAYTTNVAEISADLLTVMQAFVDKHPDFQKTPFYIFSESYGGKMTAAFSAVLYEAAQSGKIKINFKGFAMGDSWISPVDSVNSWGPYLYSTSIVSDAGLAAINEAAKKVETLVNQGKFPEAEEAWDAAESAVNDASGGVDFYNIMNYDSDDVKSSSALKFQPRAETYLERLMRRHLSNGLDAHLDKIMNGVIKEKLKIIPPSVQWGGQSSMVFMKQQGDFMKNVTSTVNNLINNTPLKVVVYEGQLDLICDTLGAMLWFDRLDIAKEFNKAKRTKWGCKTKPNGCYYEQQYKNVQFYWILDAGHMVPRDNGYGALAMVDKIIGS